MAEIMQWMFLSEELTWGNCFSDSQQEERRQKLLGKQQNKLWITRLAGLFNYDSNDTKFFSKCVIFKRREWAGQDPVLSNLAYSLSSYVNSTWKY